MKTILITGSCFLYDIINKVKRFSNAQIKNIVTHSELSTLLNSDEIENVGGLIISGGRDVDPTLYNEENIYSFSCYFSMDQQEARAIRIFHEKGIPILGICRGHQLINVALGGTLYQDISFASDFSHKDTHSVTITNDKFLRILGAPEKVITVNSIHHQVINRLGDNLDIAAICNDDNLVEAIISGNTIGVQWHPELLDDEPSNNLFEYFCSQVNSLPN